MADDVLNAIETMSMACRQCAHVTVAGIDQHRVFIATGSWSVAGAPPRLDAVLLEVNVAKNVKRPLRREQDVVVAFNPFDVQGPNRTTRRKTRPDVVLGFHLHVGRAHLRFVGLGTRSVIRLGHYRALGQGGTGLGLLRHRTLGAFHQPGHGPFFVQLVNLMTFYERM